MYKSNPTSKLNLDWDLVAQARRKASHIAHALQDFIEDHSTIAVERAVCRLMGIDGIDPFEVPLANIVVEHLAQRRLLSVGAAQAIGNAMVREGLTPQEIANAIATGSLDLAKLPITDPDRVSVTIYNLAAEGLAKIDANRNMRQSFLEKHGDKAGPYLYLIVATGNIYEDIAQATAAVKQGADIIAVIRSTGQSLLDYVPFGATTEGFGGTFATQENFRLMRTALDAIGDHEGRYIRLVNYASGLCMPEIAAIGALERLDIMLNDAFYGVLFRDINMKRTFVDQSFSRTINAYAGIIINTGEDNYLTTADAVEEAHTVLASQLMNEQLALLAGLPPEQMGLGHAFEISPDVPNGFLYELAQAQMAREIFPRAPLKYMPPTKFMTGDIFMGNVQNALFNAVTIMTGQRIHLLGILTEAIHTPFISDRALAIENARYIFTTMADISQEITFAPGGIIQTRAQEVLAKAYQLLSDIERRGIFSSIEEGIFANIKRKPDGGKGLAGVFAKGEGYVNPYMDLMRQRLASAGGERP